VFVSSRKFEAEVVRMLCAMVHADAIGGCGALTSGGTESILMAVKAYRDQAASVFGITEPEIVAGNTAHPALDKACHYLGVKLIKVPVTSATGFKFVLPSLFGFASVNFVPPRMLRL
jgi:sphinganine-1-phosphate aldolase